MVNLYPSAALTGSQEIPPILIGTSVALFNGFCSEVHVVAIVELLVVNDSVGHPVKSPSLK